MSEIVIQIKDRSKVGFLLELLGSFDFVSDLKASKDDIVEDKRSTSDFLSLAGLWAGRDIDAAALRRQAWPRQ